MIKRLIFDVDGTLIVGVNFIKPIENTLKKYNILSDNNVKLFLNGIKSYEQNYDNYNKDNYIQHFSKILNFSFDEKFI